jgi:hypothetical protein
MPSNPPSEVEARPYSSGRSPDLRLSELRLPSQDIHPSGYNIAQALALTVTR